MCVQRQGAGARLAHRIFFFEVRPEDLTRLLWVVMGAAAIGTNAGSTLLLSDTQIPFPRSDAAVHQRRDTNHVGWGEVWKHGVWRVPLTYTPMFSSLAFLLGIYALASLRLSLAADFPPLRMLLLAMAWLALAAWAASAAGPVVASWRSFRESA